MASPQLPHARRTSTTTPFPSAKHGTVQVPNPYDWLEDTSTQETTSFVEAQNAAFSEFLNDKGLVDAKQQLAKSLMDMLKLTALPSLPQIIGDEYLFRALGRGKEFGVSYRVSKAAVFGHEAVLEQTSTSVGGPEVFHDEASYGSVLTASSPSRSGRYWAFTTSDSGSDWGIIRIKDIQSQRVLDDDIRRTKFSSKPSTVIPWLGDRGFFYPYYPDKEAAGKHAGRAQLRFHEVGRPQNEDEIVYEDPDHPTLTFKAVVSEDDRFVFLEVYDKSRGCQVRAARIDEGQAGEDIAVDGSGRSGRLNLKFDSTVFSDSDSEKDYAGSSNGAHVFWTIADNGKVIAWDPKNNTIEEIVPPSERETLKLARLLPGGNVLVVRSVDVRDQVQIFSRTGRHLKTLDDLPLWTILDASIDSGTNTLFLLESSFCYPPRVWHAQITPSSADEGAIDLTPFKPLSLFPEDKPLASTLSTTQLFYPSLDSTLIPMFLTSNPLTTTTTPSAPILLYIYGGLGISVIPHFRPDFLTFTSTFAGILAVANIRGGGEYGAPWYRSACKENRQRLFDDIIAAARHLRERFGQARKIILMGESMGGLNAATAMTQAPELFDAVIINAGVVDVLHRQRVGGSGRGVQDLGDVNDPVEFDFIHQWSPMEKVLNAENDKTKAVKYPPVLLTAGDKDDFVPYSQSLKMAAALQYTTGSQTGEGGMNATRLRIISNLGHGGNISAKQKAAVGLERWLWVKKALGLEVYGS